MSDSTVSKEDTTLGDLKALMEKLNDELKADIKSLKKELKVDIENSYDELKKELKNTNYRIEMMQSSGGKINTFLDALSPAAAVGSKYQKTNSYNSE